MALPRPGARPEPANVPGAGGALKAQLLVGWSCAREGCREALAAGEAAKCAWTAPRAQGGAAVPRRAGDRDPLTDQLLGRWLPAQALAAAVWGRVGLYQAGGASASAISCRTCCRCPDRARAGAGAPAHLCRAPVRSGRRAALVAPGAHGVRTRISTICCSSPMWPPPTRWRRRPGDSGGGVPYLADVSIPEGDDDWYGAPECPNCGEPGRHCMRSIRRAASMTASTACR
jgi:hypothetical protein